MNRFRRQSRFSFVSFCNLFMQDFHGRCGNLVNLLSNSTDRNNSFTGNWRIIKTNNLVVIWKLSILLNQMILTDTGHSYEESSLILKDLLETIDSKYQGKTKGIFLPNDTFANIMLNHLIQKYGQLPDDYKIIGFDDSPVSSKSLRIRELSS